MERITTRVKDGDFERVEVGDINDYIRAAEKLADYEDTGLTPAEVRELAELHTPKEALYEGDGYADGEMVYDTWICPNCGAEYEVDFDDYDFCPDCGQSVLR